MKLQQLARLDLSITPNERHWRDQTPFMIHLITGLTILIVVVALVYRWGPSRLRDRLPSKAAYALRHARQLQGGLLRCHLCGHTGIGVDPKRGTPTCKIYACQRCGASLWRDKMSR
ncbi:hypothetical protein GCM10010971_01370 [Silvimonas amylolytica]|uniref:Uncharacterized protein n=2 Tax=Silvimonas amylolytica TaxID=449663 RepID=A0ABQ2PGA9_9NEIS|nr:hypothetical protein GCM10010971_01370 [Silvimonas amylolytica]